jgi:hypothetical protein
MELLIILVIAGIAMGAVVADLYLGALRSRRSD